MNPIVSAVNQKKVFAELLVQQAEQAAGRYHLQQALLQGAALQLEQAYHFYLAEIGETYQCTDLPARTDLWTLIANLQLQGKSSPETLEIYNLDHLDDSWLGQLRRCCQALASPPETLGVSVTDANRIPAFSTFQREDWSQLRCDQLSRWVDLFDEMVERHRQTMVEC